MAGTTALAGGLILIGLATVVSELSRLGEVLRARPAARPSRQPAEAAEPAADAVCRPRRRPLWRPPPHRHRRVRRPRRCRSGRKWMPPPRATSVRPSPVRPESVGGRGVLRRHRAAAIEHPAGGREPGPSLLRRPSSTRCRCLPMVAAPGPARASRVAERPRTESRTAPPARPAPATPPRPMRSRRRASTSCSAPSRVRRRRTRISMRSGPPMASRPRARRATPSPDLRHRRDPRPSSPAARRSYAEPAPCAAGEHRRDPQIRRRRRHGLYALCRRLDRGQASARDGEVRLDRRAARPHREQLVDRRQVDGGQGDCEVP